MSDLLAQVVQPHDNLTTFIYMLLDPTTGDVRYVGKANDPKNRYRAHLGKDALKERTPKARSAIQKYIEDQKGK